MIDSIVINASHNNILDVVSAAVRCSIVDLQYLLFFLFAYKMNVAKLKLNQEFETIQ